MNSGRGPSRAVVGCLFLALGMIGSASAARADSMMPGKLTSQPIGHYEFCKSTPSECAIRPAEQAPLRMTDAVWAMIGAVNLKVNETVKPVNDIDNYGLDEVWTYPDNGKGDCEDYALEKRRLLQAGGLSLSDLLLTVVRKPDGEGHAVLTVRSDKGDFILDNLNDEVKAWRDTGYKYLKRQASDDTGRWVSLLEDNNPVVGSLK